MGGEVSFAKKAWSEIKNFGKEAWSGVKYVAKKVSNFAKKTFLFTSLVSVMIISSVLAGAALGIIVGIIIFLGLFISGAIIFGDDNRNNNPIINQPVGGNPNFDDQPKKKGLNHLQKFMEHIQSYITDNNIDKDNKPSFLYTFVFDENKDEIINFENDENQNLEENVLVSYIFFERNYNFVKLKMVNEIQSSDNGKKILKIIQEKLKQFLNDNNNNNYDVKFIEIDQNRNREEEIDINNISDIGTTYMSISY